MYRKATILLCILLMNGFSFAIPVQDVSLEKAVKEENYLSAFHLLHISFKKTSALNKDTLSYYLYQTAACLFRVRDIADLKEILSTIERNKALINPYYYAKINVLHANYLKDKGELDKAASLLNDAIHGCKYPDVRIDYILSLASLSLIRNHTEEAAPLYHQVYENTNTDTTQLAAAYNGIGACFAYNSKYDSARFYYTRALKLYELSLGKWNTKTAQVNYNIALIDNKYGDYSSSEKIIQYVLSVYRSKLGEQHVRTAEAYGALGSIYMLQDNLEKALYYAIKERDILTAIYNNRHPDIAYSYLTTGKIYFFKNDLSAAEQQLNKGIELLTKLKETNSNVYTQLMIELSRVLTAKKEFGSASVMLNKLLSSQPIENEFKADIYLLLGDNYLQQKTPSKAYLYFKKAAVIYDTIYGKKNVYSIDALIGISNCYLQKKDFINANETAYFTTQRTISDNKIILPYDHWECRLQEIICEKEALSRNMLANKNYASYIEKIKSTLIEANQIKQTYYATGSQLHYAEKMAELNQLGIYFLTHFYKKTDSFFLNNFLFFAENNKANLLRNKITLNTSNEILPAKEQTISSAIINKLNYFTTLNENQETVDFNINDSILFYQNRYEIFTKSIEKKYPKVYHLKYGEPPLSTKQIQNKLPDNCTFLEYCNDNENYYCLAISKNKIVYKLCGNKHTIDSLIACNQDAIIHQKSEEAVSRKLYACLLPSAIQQNLLISADDMIHRVAFDALSTNQHARDYLIYHHTIQHAFSANTYFNHQPYIKNKNVIAFYPDFSNSPYAVLNNTKEHSSLKSFANYAVYYKENASKTNFVAKCNFAGIVHIGSHLITDTTLPLKSFLVFQPVDNYTLSINEIWKLNANCQLITLASCQSNFGKTQSGEGIQNFAWAFHYAGARNILSTQWNASDKSTAAIVSGFYDQLRKGKSKQEALQLAKINYLQTADAIGAQPFFWSNFYLYGDDSPVKISPHFLVKLWWMPVILLLLCYLAIVIYNKLYRKKQYDHL